MILYSASAGSGKTFTLAREYIRLVMRDPDAFKGILAVTFTNKATEEMKGRILEELYRLSLARSSVIRDFLVNEEGLSTEEVTGRAGIILENILQHYSRFHVETIDRFFQRAIRAFTREIGLSGGYEVELDTGAVLSEAVDQLLDQLDSHPEQQQWLVSFARSKVQEGRSWNLREDLLDLGKELNREQFQANSQRLIDQIADKNAYRSFLGELMAGIHRFESELQNLSSEALKHMHEAGLTPDDFKGAYGVGYFFNRLSSGDFRPPSTTVRNAADDPEAWYTRKAENKSIILAFYEHPGNDILKDILALFEASHAWYLSAKAVRGYLYTLALLTDIAAQMRRYADSHGIFLLSDAGSFLKGIIGENEAPFIYEKIGNYFQHFMIDEFQDTSGLQWENFKPLIDNSLANNHECLLVGDVKQSIYRWRNSDWENLSERIPASYPGGVLDQQQLKHNWRSLKEIVGFNNLFFRAARNIFQDLFAAEPASEAYAEKVGRAYRDIDQHLPDQKKADGGFVRISRLKGAGEEDWKSEAMRQLIGMIKQLQDQKYHPSDIAILVRYKKEGKEIADALLEQKTKAGNTGYHFDVISDESLFLEGAISVRILIGAMRYLSTPGDSLNLAQLRHDCQLALKPGGELLTEQDAIFRPSSAHGPLPEDFISERISLRYLTLHELTDRLMVLFGLEKLESETPFLVAFQDLVMDFCRSGHADINAFLEWWTQHGEEASLPVAEDQEAIRIMTVHKAKGLEFKAVLLPFGDWKLDHSGRREILWCKPRGAPFDRLPLLPVRYGAALGQSLFAEAYHAERFRIFVDHLNLLYVSFTRARDVLWVTTPWKEEQTPGSIGGLIGKVLMQPALADLMTSREDTTGMHYEKGRLPVSDTAGPVRSGLNILQQVHTQDIGDRLRFRNRGRAFFSEETGGRRFYGQWMHGIFERIHRIDDVGSAISFARREGIIDEPEGRRLEQEIRRMLEIEPLKSWFDGSWRVITEQDILTPEGTMRRPDRVMIRDGEVLVVDYKFGHHKNRKDVVQVREYVDMLRKMNADDVKGFIWYMNLQEIINIDAG